MHIMSRVGRSTSMAILKKKYEDKNESVNATEAINLIVMSFNNNENNGDSQYRNT